MTEEKIYATDGTIVDNTVSLEVRDDYSGKSYSERFSEKASEFYHPKTNIWLNVSNRAVDDTAHVNLDDDIDSNGIEEDVDMNAMERAFEKFNM